MRAIPSGGPSGERSRSRRRARPAAGRRRLAEEERDVVPLISAHLSQAEWEHLGKVAFAKFTPKQRFVALGEMLAAARPDEAARMMASLPPPVRVVWRLVGRRQYQRLVDRLGAGTGTGATGSE